MTTDAFMVYRGVSTTFHALAIIVTVFRIYHRHQKRQLWWDDFWAVISLFSDLIMSLTPWLRNGAYDTREPLNRLIVVYWLTAISPPLVTWAARISIGMSIARLVPSKTRTRLLLYAMNGIFSLACLVVLFEKIWTCTRNTSWHKNQTVQCYFGSTLGIISLCTEPLADACLVTIPLRMLWRVNLPRKQRRLILAIFASSVISLTADIIYAILIFVYNSHPDPQRWGYYIGMLAHIKTAIGLLVCNLLVVVTHLYCLFWREEGDDDISEPTETRSNKTTPVPFTEISTMDISAHLSLSTGSSESRPVATSG